MQMLYALPPRLQLQALVELAQYLALPLGRELSIPKAARLRGQALGDLKRAADWLGLPDGVAPKVREYKRAAAKLHLMSFKEVHEAWSLFSFAQDAFEGRWVPQSPAQRAHRRATAGKARTHETYLAGIRKWQRASGTVSRKAAEYDEFVTEYDDKLPPGVLPLVGSAAVRAAFPGLSFEEVVAGAFGELDPYALVAERAEDAAGRAMTTHGLVGTTEAAAILGVSKNHFSDLARLPDFPVAVGIVAGKRLWEVEDVRAYADGLPVARRKPYERQSELLSSAQVADLLGTTAAYVNTAIYRAYGSVPAPDHRGSPYAPNVWLRSTVEKHLAEHGPIGGRRGRQRKSG